jgi:YHS domain-containing protein
MARIIIWVILAIIVIRILWRFVRAIMEGAGMVADPRAPKAVKLVRDPVCGVFVAPSQALTAGSGSSTKYFCSEKCRQAWSRR